MNQVSSRVKRAIWVAVVVLIAVILVALRIRYEQTQLGVTVFVDAMPVECTATTVDVGTVETRAPTMQLVSIEPAMACTLRFYVANDTGHNVTVESISIPVLGPAGGPGIMATRLDPATTADAGPVAGEVNAVWNRSDQVMPDTMAPYEVAIRYRPDGCTVLGGTLSFALPTVILGTWFMDVEVGGGFLPVGFVGTGATSC